MSTQPDAFLRDLQMECLKSGSDHIGAFREALLGLSSHPFEAVSALMKACHSLKGDLQAVGFLDCAEFVHSLEAAVENVQDQAKQSGEKFSERDAPMVEFLLSDAIQSLEGYLLELEANPVDTPERRERRISVLNILTMWRAGLTMSVDTSIGADDVEQPPVPILELVSEPVPEPKCEPELALEPELAPDIPYQPVSRMFLLCRNGNRHIGLPIENILEIVQSRAWTRLPCVRTDMVGLMNLHGEVIPILNTHERLGSSLTQEKGLVVVCSVNANRFGFPVEEAEQVLEIDTNAFQPAEQLAERRGDPTVITHFFQKEEQTILIVNLDRLVSA